MREEGDLGDLREPVLANAGSHSKAHCAETEEHQAPAGGFGYGGHVVTDSSDPEAP